MAKNAGFARPLRLDTGLFLTKEKPVTVRLGRGAHDVVTIYPPPPDSLTPERRLAIRRAVEKSISAGRTPKLPHGRSP